MHSRTFWKSIEIGQALFVIVAVKIIALALNSELDLYIHPRYIVFTSIMAILGLVVFAVSLFVDQHHHSNRKTSRRWIIDCLLLTLFAAIVFGIPPNTLSSRTAGVRSETANLKQSSRKVTITSDSEKLKIEDWAALLGRPSDVKKIIGKKANITGFVIPSAYDKNTLLVTRFVVACCAIDATPLEVPVYFVGWDDVVDSDEWVEVRGVFAEREGRPVLQATEFRKINRPDNPYAY